MLKLLSKLINQKRGKPIIINKFKYKSYTARVQFWYNVVKRGETVLGIKFNDVLISIPVSVHYCSN